MSTIQQIRKKEHHHILSAEAFYKKAMGVAGYYGFSTLNELFSKKILPDERKRDKDPWHDLCQQEKMSVMKMYVDKLMHLPLPVQFFWRPTDSSRKDLARFSLEVIGGGRSISEGLALATARAILQEVGYKQLMVGINSLGDRDCFASFQRDVAAYVRKHASALCAKCREGSKKDVFTIFSCENKACRELVDVAPRSISHLNEDARQHFKEILEYLEGMDIPYELDHTLVGESSHCFKTVFEIRALTEEGAQGPTTTLARGGRYDSLAKRLGLKREVSAVGITLECPATGASRKDITVRHKKTEIYFIQLGFEAKRRALELLELLRQHNIAVMQSLSKDKLGSQLALAEKLNVPITLIVGHKEAVEGTVIVRSMVNRSQETVPLLSLVDYLKRNKV